MLYNIPCIIYLFLYTPALLFGQINPLFYNIFFYRVKKKFFYFIFFYFLHCQEYFIFFICTFI